MRSLLREDEDYRGSRMSDSPVSTAYSDSMGLKWVLKNTIYIDTYYELHIIIMGVALRSIRAIYNAWPSLETA